MNGSIKIDKIIRSKVRFCHSIKLNVYKFQIKYGKVFICETYT